MGYTWMYYSDGVRAGHRMRRGMNAKREASRVEGIAGLSKVQRHTVSLRERLANKDGLLDVP